MISQANEVIPMTIETTGESATRFITLEVERETRVQGVKTSEFELPDAILAS
jgi:hypothetical protein